MRVAAIVPAAGKGTRIKSRTEKPYIRIKGKPMLAWTLLRLSRIKDIKEIVVAVGRNRLQRAQRDIIDRYKIKKTRLVEGGRERKDSVEKALRSISPRIDYVLIHDGSRPFVGDSVIKASLKEARRSGAAVAAVPVKPTLKYAANDGRIRYTPDRRVLWEAQTPQVFKRDLIEKAYKEAAGKKVSATDDSMLVEAIGVRPRIVMGSYRNIKVTTREDLELAKILMTNDRVQNSK